MAAGVRGAYLLALGRVLREVDVGRVLLNRIDDTAGCELDSALFFLGNLFGVEDFEPG